jgi:hypothetical protein
LAKLEARTNALAYFGSLTKKKILVRFSSPGESEDEGAFPDSGCSEKKIIKKKLFIPLLAADFAK